MRRSNCSRCSMSKDPRVSCHRPKSGSSKFSMFPSPEQMLFMQTNLDLNQPWESSRDNATLVSRMEDKCNESSLNSNGSNKYECSICSKTFLGKWAMNRHFRTHTGERNYVCKICNKAFGQKTHLDRHFRMHSGVKPFLCLICRKTFHSKDHLKRHLLVHKKNNLPVI